MFIRNRLYNLFPVINISSKATSKGSLFTTSTDILTDKGTSDAASRDILTDKGNPDHGSTVNEAEVNKFKVLAEQWWQENGDFKALHEMNRLRVPLVRDAMMKYLSDTTDKTPVLTHPLKGISILDVGCGGGILAEPLARLGADVTGIDACEEGVEVARLHADPELDNLKYIHSTVEDHALTNVRYDAVISSEVIEHVDNPQLFIKVISEMIKPRGSLFLTTLNRSMQSWLGAIIAAEYILRIVPAGTHDWNKFIAPDELQLMVENHGFHVKLIHGMAYMPGFNKWMWTKNTGINYALHAVKLAQQ